MEVQQLREALAIRRAELRPRLQQRLQLGSEPHAAILDLRDVERLDAERIPRQVEAARLGLPAHDGAHVSAQAVFVAGEEHRCVAAVRRNAHHGLPEQQLAVERDDDASVRARERLVSLRAAAYTQARCGQAEAVLCVHALLIRAAVADPRQQCPQLRLPDRTRSRGTQDADEAAHGTRNSGRRRGNRGRGDRRPASRSRRTAAAAGRPPRV